MKQQLEVYSTYLYEGSMSMLLQRGDRYAVLEVLDKTITLMDTNDCKIINVSSSLANLFTKIEEQL